MAKVVGVTTSVLSWARETKNLTIEAVARRLKKAPETVAAWEDEDSDALPSYGQLEKLAYEIYHRPLAIFYFPEPPEEEDARAEFRLLPSSEILGLEPDTLLASREAYAMQESLRELTGGRNPSDEPIFREINARRSRSLVALCNRVREFLGVSLIAQSEWSSADEAFKGWRGAVEAKGVYVFKRSIKQKAISGFCLTDEEFPVIYINNSTTDSRQIFTLFHELAHILYSISGITKTDLSYLAELTSEDRALEIQCNRFAGELLVPSESFRPHLESWDGTEVQVEHLASLYNVSREVILRKLLDAGRVSQDFYETKVLEWFEEYERLMEFQKERQRELGRGGGNYYATQAAYLGPSYLRLAFNSYYNGRSSLESLAGHLNMKARSVERLESFLTGGT